MSELNLNNNKNRTSSSSNHSDKSSLEFSYHSKSSSSGEPTVIHNPKYENNSENGNDGPNTNNMETGCDTAFYLITSYVDNLQHQSMLYENELKSIENLDFNMKDLLKMDNHDSNANDMKQSNDDANDNVYLSKMIAEIHQTTKQISILSTKEYEYWLKKMNSQKIILENIIDNIEDTIKNFQQIDLL